jgi:hypothetical protein
VEEFALRVHFVNYLVKMSSDPITAEARGSSMEEVIDNTGRGLARRKQKISRSRRAGLHFSVGRLARKLKEGRYADRVALGAPLFMAGVLEYITNEVPRRAFSELLCDCEHLLLCRFCMSLLSLPYTEY